MKKSQCDRLLEWLATCGPIGPMTALNTLGIYRLSARVHDLRKQGWDIEKEMVKVKNQFGESCRVAQYDLTIEDLCLEGESHNAA